MKIYLTLLFSLIGGVFLSAQTTKVAILDFENTSGKTEYDALGKAISSMLITDLANNIHPKKVEFFERSQLNKLLDEQKLQKSKNFDAKTAVDFGKLSGVNYVFVGSVFVLDGTCNFSSKLVDVQTSKILIAKDVSGKIEAWLKLKSQLAEAIANQLNNPITINPSYKDQNTSLATINQYGKVLTTMDDGDAEKAEQMRSLFEETNPDFKYFTDIKEDIEELKKQVKKNTADIEVLNKSGGRVINASSLEELFSNLSNPLSTFLEKKTIVTDILIKYGENLNEKYWSYIPAYPDPEVGNRLKDFDFEKNDSLLYFYKKIIQNPDIKNEVKQRYILSSIRWVNMSTRTFFNYFPFRDSLFEIKNELFLNKSFLEIKNKVSNYYYSIFHQIDTLAFMGLSFNCVAIMKISLMHSFIRETWEFPNSIVKAPFSIYKTNQQETFIKELAALKLKNPDIKITDSLLIYLNILEPALQKLNKKRINLFHTYNGEGSIYENFCENEFFPLAFRVYSILNSIEKNLFSYTNCLDLPALKQWFIFPISLNKRNYICD
jgi:TolB-like protein